MTLPAGAAPDEARAATSWHALPAAEALAAFATDPARGLDTAEVERRLASHGPNRLPAAPPRSPWARLGRQFQSPLIYLLLVAAAIAVPLGDLTDALVIVAVVILNALIGAFQEGRAEQALAALQRMSSPAARVVRDGHEAVVVAADVVPGDVLLLAAGDAVAADARLVEGTALQLAEAALTGESTPVAKSDGAVAAHAPLAERASMVYAGTHVTAGRARAIVVATGRDSELGRIATLAARAVPPKTPLERRVDRFGRQLMAAAGVVLVVVLAVGLARGIGAGEIAMVGISQVVGMVPEGLPVAMTIALAVGVQRMARRRAVVRRLAAVETLGSTTIICTDKTGTLTRNEMTATAVYLPGHGALAVTGAGYDPAGEIEDAPGSAAALTELLAACALCNDASLSGPHADAPRWRAIGDPTEAALVTLAIKGGVVPAELRAARPRLAELPFDADTRMMATQHGGAAPVVYVKGAPEVVLAMLADEAVRAAAAVAADALAARALRVLAVVAIDGAAIDGGRGAAAFTGRARLLGLVGQLDPPRPEVAAAVAACRSAGIRVVMVTGDHRATAVAIALQLGLRTADAVGDVLDGTELDALDDRALTERLARVSVLARAHPAQKLRVVEALQRQGQVVAVTGDGVNDTPALATADVGVAMGVTGTEVAKEAAKIVIADDNFATIAAAVEEGRVVHGNIKKAIVLLAATSFAEVAILVLAVALGYPPPFAAVQILWNNLVTEGVITVNLIMEPAEGDEMGRRPTPLDEPLLTRSMWWRIGLITPTITAVTLGWFVWRLEAGVSPAIAQTEAFTLLVVCEWFNVVNCRSDHRSAFDRSAFANPWLIGGLVIGNLLQLAVVFWPALNRVFHTVPLTLTEALAIGAAASLVLWVEEARKLLARRRVSRRSRGPATPP